MSSNGISTHTESALNELTEDPVPNVGEVSQYKKWKKIGFGAFGSVYSARDFQGNIVALKEIKGFTGTKFPEEVLKEIRIHDRVPPGNVAVLIHVCKNRSKIAASLPLRPTYYLVFEFGEHDLASLLKNSNLVFSLGEIKHIMQQMFQGLETMHVYKVIHGNLKPSNVRMSMDGTVKLVKFDWTRIVCANAEMSKSIEKQESIWYSSPEELLNKTNCNHIVDSWSAGCIMAELFIRGPLMQGKCLEEQLILINKLCGPITQRTFPGCKEIALYKQLKLSMGHQRQIKTILQKFVQDSRAMDVLGKLLTLDPARRMDCPDALQHSFFSTDPLPCSLTSLMGRHCEPKDLHHTTTRRNVTSLNSDSQSDRTTGNGE